MKRDVADTVKLCIFVGGHACHRSVQAKEYREVNAAYRFARLERQWNWGWWNWDQWNWDQWSWDPSCQGKQSEPW